MNAAGLTLELDVAPGDLRSRRPVDFAGRLVACFTRLTPFRPSEWGAPPEPSLVVRATASQGGKRWALEPHPDNRWPSGRRMTAAEIAQSITTGTHANSAAVVAEARVVRGTVLVDLNRPFGCLPALLSAEAFAPVRDPSGENAGPFSYAGGLGAHGFGLRRNAVGDRLWPDGPETLVFAVTANPDQGVRLFNRGLIDVTCNPTLPSMALQAHRRSPALRRRDLLLAGLLLFARPYLRAPEARDLRRQVSAAIDREGLCADDDNGLSPLYDLTDLWRDASRPRDDAISLRGWANSGPLTLAYADFAPNGAVAARIAKDLRERLDLAIVLRPMSYAAYLDSLAEPDADLIYSLIQPPFNDPTGLLASLAPWLGARAQEYRAAVHAAEAVSDPHERFVACAEAAQILAAEAPFVSVARAESRCLVSDRAATLRLGPDGLFRPPSRAS